MGYYRCQNLSGNLRNQWKKDPSRVRKDRDATCGSGNPSATDQQEWRSFKPCPSTLKSLAASV